MCDVNYDGECSVWNETVVIARKQHVCDACRGFIRPGQPYTKIFSVYEGDVTNAKQCGPCSILCDEFTAEHGVGFHPTNATEMLQHCIDEEGASTPSSKRWQRHLYNMERRRESRKRAAAS